MSALADMSSLEQQLAQALGAADAPATVCAAPSVPAAPATLEQLLVRLTHLEARVAYLEGRLRAPLPRYRIDEVYSAQSPVGTPPSYVGALGE